MATLKIPFFREKPGANGGKRYFWDPSASLRKQGWTCVRLSDDRRQAIAEAQARNAELDRWRTSSGLAVIAGWAGDEPVVEVKRKFIKTWYADLYHRAPHRANYVMRVLRVVLRHAVDEEWIEHSPMTKFGLKQPGRDVEPVLWSDEAITAFVARADALGRHSLGTAVLLNSWLGQREGDIIRISKAAYRDSAIWVRQRKTSKEVDLPVDEVPMLARRLAEELARQVTAMTIIASETTGRPYTEDNFRHTFADIRDQVPECRGLRFMWLRHTAVTRLAEDGSPTSEIAAISGHSDKTINEIIARYRVRTKKMAVSAFQRRLRAERG